MESGISPVTPLMAVEEGTVHIWNTTVVPTYKYDISLTKNKELTRSSGTMSSISLHYHICSK
jgi:hypothetical protein